MATPRRRIRGAGTMTVARSEMRLRRSIRRTREDDDDDRDDIRVPRTSLFGRRAGRSLDMVPVVDGGGDVEMTSNEPFETVAESDVSAYYRPDVSGVPGYINVARPQSFVVSNPSGIAATAAGSVDQSIRRGNYKTLVTNTKPNVFERMFHHGNYMGSNWNNGRYQTSQLWHNKPPVDYGDYRSMVHDDDYAKAAGLVGGGRLDALSVADKKYFNSMMGRGSSVGEIIRNTIAGEAVGLQGEARSFLKMLGIVKK